MSFPIPPVDNSALLRAHVALARGVDLAGLDVDELIAVRDMARRALAAREVVSGPEQLLLEAEQEVLESLASAWRLFVLLPRRHPDELREARAHFHALQQTLMARAAVRAYPDRFVTDADFV